MHVFTSILAFYIEHTEQYSFCVAFFQVTSEPVCNFCLSRATIGIAKNIILACPITKHPQILFYCGFILCVVGDSEREALCFPCEIV